MGVVQGRFNGAFSIFTASRTNDGMSSQHMSLKFIEFIYLKGVKKLGVSSKEVFQLLGGKHHDVSPLKYVLSDSASFMLVGRKWR